ncbi:nucleic-acid-binding protein from transposon X-element [Trichonephila clavipes]|nr:nucleic-acid-binding protein from transposon X-element [Trichonephila clavipes]
MSDFSENMEVSPTRQAQVAACEKLRDTVTGISALHLSLQDGRSPNPQNSFTELYRMSTQAMIKRKEEMDPIVTSNNFSDLEQDVEHPLPTTNQVTAEVVTPKIKLPHPIMLKIKKNFREQIKRINEKFPNIRNRTVNDVVKMFTNDHEEYRNLIHFLESDKNFEFYIIKRNIDKPIKAVIKGLPNSSKIEDKTKDLADEGFVIDSCTQLISKRTKKEHTLPYFLVILPRNDKNSKIFDLAHLSYLQVKVEGYLVRGITQCFNCNNFFHTAANCFMKPRCLKCGKEHATKNCHIKERITNPLFVLTARTSVTWHVIQNAPNSPSLRKEPLLQTQLKRKISSVNGLKREFPSLTLLVGKSPAKPYPKIIIIKRKTLHVNSLAKIIILQI